MCTPSHLFPINQADGSHSILFQGQLGRETHLLLLYLPGSVSSNDEDRKLSKKRIVKNTPREGNELGLITVPREYTYNLHYFFLFFYIANIIIVLYRSNLL